MGEYCAAAAAAAADGDEPAVAVLPRAARRPYGEYDRFSTKQVFDNLHGNISLDPVSDSPPPTPYPLLTSPLRVAAIAVVRSCCFVAAAGGIGWLIGVSARPRAPSVSADWRFGIGHWRWSAPGLIVTLVPKFSPPFGSTNRAVCVSV
jgi:hypothetical protein